MTNFSSSSHRLLESLVAVLAMVVLLAGCGDVRGQADEGRVLTLTAQGARYLALQDGLGAWHPLSTRPNDRVFTVSLADPQGRYGVMGVCLDEASGALSVSVKHGVVPAVSGATPPLVSLACSKGESAAGTRYEVRGQVRGLAAGEYGSVYLGEASSLVDASSPAHRLELRRSAASERLELIASKYSSEARLPSVMLVTPALELHPDGPVTADIDFSSASAFVPEVAQVPLGGVQPGELLSGSVELVSATGTHALLGEFIGNGALSYARPPERVLRRAALRAEAQSFTYDKRSRAGLSRSVTRTYPAGVVEPLMLPPPVDLRALTLHSDRTQLRPRAAWRTRFAQEGVYTQFYSQIQAGRSLSYRLSQSAAYLKGLSPGRAEASYLLPDFRALPEWQANWELRRGLELFWDVSYRLEGAGETVFSSRSGVLSAAHSR